VNEETLYKHIFDAFLTIRNRLGTFVSVRPSMIRRVRMCIDSGEGHFEHILSSDVINNKHSTVIKSIIYISNCYIGW
jgi:hypothetical protein